MFAGTVMLCFSLKYETYNALTDVQCQIFDKFASMHIKKTLLREISFVPLHFRPQNTAGLLTI
jgi:hypothetical protein